MGSGTPAAKTNWAAPITRARPPGMTQPEYLRALEKPMARAASGAAMPTSEAWRMMAVAVSLASWALARTTLAAASSTSDEVAPSTPTARSKSMEPEVMVPVLSRHSTSTRASASMQ